MPADSVLSLRTWILLVLALIIMCLPRFDKNTFLFPASPGDEVVYRNYVKYFRAEEVTGPLSSASTWRPLVPFLAAYVPFRPLTALNVVNMASLFLALFFLAKILAFFALPRSYIVGGCGLFIFSFPVLYYGTIGYVDPMLVGLVTLGVYLILTRHRLAFTLLLVPGLLAKEGIIVLLLPALYFLIVGGFQRRYWIYPVLWVAIYVGLSVAVRRYAPGISYDSFWIPSVDKFLQNASRSRVWLSALLTFGPPGLIAFMMMARSRCFSSPFRPRRVMLSLGFIAVICTWLFALVTAYVDGRTLWIAYPFTIPLAMIWLYERKHGQRQSPASNPLPSSPDVAAD